jgi:hypothetical protein
MSSLLMLLPLGVDVREWLSPFRMRRSFVLFDILPQLVIMRLQQATDHRRTDWMACSRQLVLDIAQPAIQPLRLAHGVPRRMRFDQRQQLRR